MFQWTLILQHVCKRWIDIKDLDKLEQQKSICLSTENTPLKTDWWQSIKLNKVYIFEYNIQNQLRLTVCQCFWIQIKVTIQRYTFVSSSQEKVLMLSSHVQFSWVHICHHCCWRGNWKPFDWIASEHPNPIMFPKNPQLLNLPAWCIVQSPFSDDLLAKCLYYWKKTTGNGYVSSMHSASTCLNGGCLQWNVMFMSELKCLVLKPNSVTVKFDVSRFQEKPLNAC